MSTIPFESAQTFLDQGRQHEQAGDMQAARQACLKALELEPHCAEAWLMLAKSYARESNWEQALATSLKAFQAMSTTRADGYVVSPQTAGELHYVLAQAYRQQAQPEEAIFELKLAVHYLPEHLHAQHDLGMTCWEEGRLEEATRHLARALNLQYDAPDTLRAFQYALARLQTLKAHSLPAPARDAFERGLALYNKRSFADAIPQFKTALNAAPAYAEAMCYLGLCQLALQDAAGLEHIERAAKIEADNADILRHLAWSYTNAGRLAEASALYVRATQICPTHVAAQAELSALYLHQKQWTQAFDTLKRARFYDQAGAIPPQALLSLCQAWVKAEPRNARARYELGLRYLTTDNWQAAAAEFVNALHYGFEQSGVYAYLGLALLETEQWSKAIQSFKTALERQGSTAVLHTALAYVYFIGLKDGQRALAECRSALRCLEASPSHALYRLLRQMTNKIQHPSREDQHFWSSTHRHIKAEICYGL